MNPRWLTEINAMKRKPPSFQLRQEAEFDIRKLSPKQQEALHKAVTEEIEERQQRWDSDYEAMILWVLHAHLGFGRERLLRFREWFKQDYQEMKLRYEMSDCYPEKSKLKDETGIDVDALLAAESGK